MNPTETRTELPISKARMPFRIAAFVLAVLSPLGLIPIVVALTEAGSATEVFWLVFGAVTVLVCMVMFAKTALTGRTPMYTSRLAKAVNLLDVD